MRRSQLFFPSCFLLVSKKNEVDFVASIPVGKPKIRLPCAPTNDRGCSACLLNVYNCQNVIVTRFGFNESSTLLIQSLIRSFSFRHSDGGYVVKVDYQQLNVTWHDRTIESRDDDEKARRLRRLRNRDGKGCLHSSARDIRVIRQISDSNPVRSVSEQ